MRAFILKVFATTFVFSFGQSLYSDVGDEYWEGGLDHSYLSAEAYPLAPAHLAKGEVMQVVARKNGRVIAERADGSRTSVSNEELGLLKGERFAGGMVKVVESRVRVVERVSSKSAVNAGYYTKPPMELQTAVSLILKASENYDDVLLGMLFFNDLGEHEFFVRNVGSLASGEVRTLSYNIPAAFDASRAEVNYAVLLFCPEGEIVTEGRRQMTPFLNGMFESFYSELVFAYQENSGSRDRPVSLVQQYPVTADLGTDGPLAADPVFFTLSVDERGFVKRIESSVDLPAELYAACERSFREWLFLPKIEAGFPRPSRVRVPVRF